MQRRGFTAVELPIVLGAVALTAAFLGPVFSRSSDNARRAACQSNLKQIGLGIAQYVQDYDELYPRVSVHPVTTNVAPYSRTYGWADALYPYLRSVQVYQCPSDKRPPNRKGDAVKANFTDYWLNTHLSGVSMADISQYATTISLGDGNDGRDMTNARYSKAALPTAWLRDARSPARRHMDVGANYAFLDGHVKWLRTNEVMNYAGRKNSFLLK